MDVWTPRRDNAVLGVLQNESSSAPSTDTDTAANAHIYPLTEPMYSRKLCMAGHKLGVTVLVFSPLHIDWDNMSVTAYHYHAGGWETRHVALPALVYDRCTYANEMQHYRTKVAMSRMQRAGIRWLGIGLGGKWDIFRSLSTCPDLAPIMPPTTVYKGMKALAEQLNHHDANVFLKPQGGSHGRSTLHVRRARADEGQRTMYPLQVRGRNRDNSLVQKGFSTVESGLQWIDHFISKRRYIVQPYLSLTDQEERPFDVRVLMQKNERGQWKFTGMAVRVGCSTSVTSNLHGGGHSVQALPFLIEQFGPSEAERLASTIRHYSKLIPPALEQRHGRLSELGLDFGIDRNAHLWLLEVNSKPGRNVFSQSGERDAALKSVEYPILYARHVMVRHLRRVCP
ncbi:YheC/YheD family endospore coat-associated protein [Paenibacillus sp. 481]|uniref:YheC/YheD family endospore coat-associated protein n=1 Tax=Paenibacillus sp. 481 TaxID=2835869 RepID=UPI001E32C76F|nr:YheC/YheD family protein [Paenibacillus sp. 481]UHA72420.1 YheC/YheD family protein [Paenibacillus sp. 481]